MIYNLISLKLKGKKKSMYAYKIESVFIPIFKKKC